MKLNPKTKNYLYISGFILMLIAVPIAVVPLWFWWVPSVLGAIFLWTPVIVAIHDRRKQTEQQEE